MKQVLRLRVGAIFILFWWIPIWLLAPAISSLLGYGNDPSASHKIFVGIALIQTVIGILGVIMVGKEIYKLIKKVPKRQVPKKIWKIIWTGKTEEFPT